MCLVFTDHPHRIEPNTEYVEPFKRITYAGAVEVYNWTPDMDLISLYPYPPAKVRDLKYVQKELSLENRTLVLRWTAVGDYIDDETGKPRQQENN